MFVCDTKGHFKIMSQLKGNPINSLMFSDVSQQFDVYDTGFSSKIWIDNLTLPYQMWISLWSSLKLGHFYK